jgi:hypothetical protein
MMPLWRRALAKRRKAQQDKAWKAAHPEAAARYRAAFKARHPERKKKQDAKAKANYKAKDPAAFRARNLASYHRCKSR